jgi:membrane-bound serine protease (ClpP class)
MAACLTSRACSTGQIWPTCLAGLVLLCLAAAVARPASAQSPNRVFVTEVNGVIGVATTRQISQAIQKARQENASALVMRLDTPGGLVSSTRDIIKEMIASPVPVIVYVAPSGARAASAGTYITYASNLAAMAPGTNIGAATPIEIGGVPGLPGSQPKDKESKGEPKSDAQNKAINDAVAMMRSFAQLRGRNADWGEKAVRDAATLTALEAQKEGVVELVADNLNDLLTQADGRNVTVAGVQTKFTTRNAEIIAVAPDWRTKALSAISDPNIAFLLMLIGFYGLILEFWNPGSFAPGVIGAISLIVGLTALTALPVNYGALGLLVLGILLMIGEAFTPGIGALGIGGLAAFIVGGLFLFEGGDTDIEFAVSRWLIFGSAIATAGMIVAIGGAAWSARKRAPVTGSEQMIGMRGEVVGWSDGRGSVRVHGEIWSARANRPLQVNDTIRVVGREGLTLIVEP